MEFGRDRRFVVSVLVLFLFVVAFVAVRMFSGAVDAVWMTAFVVDAMDGTPVENVTVEASFENDNGWEAWTNPASPNHDRQRTGQNGICRLAGRTNTGHAGCWVTSPPTGYYGAGGRSFDFKRKDLFGTWQPDNLVATIRLQRVERPIPLMVQRVGSDLDRLRRKVGRFDGTNMVVRYDLLKGDYLPPDGKGEVGDLVIETRAQLEVTNISRRLVARFYDFENAISFPGEGNGLLKKMTHPTDGVKLRVAPVTGYESGTVLHCGIRKKLIVRNVSHDDYTATDPDRCYYFRIRSRYDEQGRLVEAYYGKIYGDFKFHYESFDEGCRTEFLYYLNPNPLDTNLEWDCKTNLCPMPNNLGTLHP